MPTVKIAILATVLVSLLGLMTRNDKDRDEQQTSVGCGRLCPNSAQSAPASLGHARASADGLL